MSPGHFAAKNLFLTLIGPKLSRVKFCLFFSPENSYLYKRCTDRVTNSYSDVTSGIQSIELDYFLLAAAV